MVERGVVLEERLQYAAFPGAIATCDSQVQDFIALQRSQKLALVPIYSSILDQNWGQGLEEWLVLVPTCEK